MRAVMRKELRELLVIALPMWIVGGIVAASEIAGGWDHTEDMVGAALVAGLALGLAQGLLDQFRRNDEFLKHRPLSADRLQLARTGAGLLILAVALVIFFASLWIATWVEALQLERLRARAGTGFLQGHDPIHYGLATHVLVVALTYGSWALARYVAGLRPYLLVVPASLVVPVAAWGLVSRTPTPATAAVVAGVLGLVFFGLVHVRETGRRGAGAHALLLGALLLVGLEGGLWARSALSELQQSAYPRYGLDAEGTVRTWRWSWPEGELELDADRRVVKRWPHGHHDDAPSRALPVHGGLRGEGDTLAYEQMDDPRFVPDARHGRLSGTSWGETVASALGRLEGRARSGRPVRAEDIVRWSYGDGRLRCWRGVHAIEIETLAWVGPDGFHEGAPARDAPRFGDDYRLLAYDPAGGTWTPDEGPWTLVTYGEAGSIFLRAITEVDGEPVTPIRVEVQQRPFVPYAGPLSARPTIIPEDRRYWLLDPLHGLLEPRTLRDDEMHPRQPWYVSRRDSGQEGGLETWLRPQHPTRYGARLRYFGQDGTEHVGEVHFQPTTTTEKVPAAAMGLLGMIRPPLLNAWAFASDGPMTRSAMNRWWWRDPLFSAGSYGGWLLASLAVGALMALLAWRSARMRLPTRAAQLRWVCAVFLLGPIGLLWMKLAIGRTAVLPVGDGRRAVDLDATPDNRAPWPVPTPRGTEVFSRQ